MNWKQPVKPIMTDALLSELIKQDEERGPKPTAFVTPFRYSSAGDCARSLSYQALGYEPTNKFDGPSIWVTTLGTAIHEWVQEAIARRFPGAEFETKSKVDDIASGHADGVVESTVITAVIPEWNGGRVLYELKTMGGFSFEKSIGLKKQKRVLENPEGPRHTALLQASLNALANDCDTIIIGHISLEGISKGVAASVGLDDYGRVLAEWHIPKEVWLPWAEEERFRMRKILGGIEAGMIAGRIIPDDDGNPLPIDPTSSRPYWKCDYCSFKDLCVSHGSGIVTINSTKE